jgi:hypothetical protein
MVWWQDSDGADSNSRNALDPVRNGITDDLQRATVPLVPMFPFLRGLIKRGGRKGEMRKCEGPVRASDGG